MTVPVLIDCDPGHDDAIALLLAVASPEIDVLGVTTVCGNSTLDKTTANAIRVLEFVDRGDVPVAAGADRPLVREAFVADVRPRGERHGRADAAGAAGAARGGARRRLPRRTHSGLARAVTLVPVGPLTNVALLLARHPGAAQRLDRIVLMGGAIAEGNVTPAAEFNIWADPEAAARVFESGLDITMIGLDVTHKALLTSRCTASGSGRKAARGQWWPTWSTSSAASTGRRTTSTARRSTTPLRSPR